MLFLSRNKLDGHCLILLPEKKSLMFASLYLVLFGAGTRPVELVVVVFIPSALEAHCQRPGGWRNEEPPN